MNPCYLAADCHEKGPYEISAPLIKDLLRKSEKVNEWLWMIMHARDTILFVMHCNDKGPSIILAQLVEDFQGKGKRAWIMPNHAD